MPKRVSYSARDAFEAKVKLLEAWLRDGVPPGVVLPKTITALARWTDSSLGLIAWQKPNIHSPNGKYGDLRLRADVALEKLNAVVSKIPPSGRTDREFCDTLMEQLIRLRGQLVLVQEKAVREEDRADELQRTNQKLLQQIASLRSLHSLPS